jgi:hypothetical protein
LMINWSLIRYSAIRSTVAKPGASQAGAVTSAGACSLRKLMPPFILHFGVSW